MKTAEQVKSAKEWEKEEEGRKKGLKPPAPLPVTPRSSLRVNGKKVTAARITEDLAPKEEAPAPSGPAGGQQKVPALLPLSAIMPSPLNPRKDFDEKSLAELAESIKSEGLIQPLIVRLAGPAQLVGAYELICGERRYRACQIAGVETVPCVLWGNVSDQQLLRMAVIENLQRKDISPIEQAGGFQRLLETGMKQGEIATSIGVQQPLIAKYMMLLQLPEPVQDMVERGSLSMSHGVALHRFKDFPKLCTAMAGVAAADRTPAKELEKGIPGAWNYEGKGLIKSLHSWETAFDWRETCHECPYDAFRKDSSSGGDYCLRPEHYKELNDAAIKAKKEQTQELVKSAAESGGRIIKLRDLKYDQFTLIGISVPEGCSEQCKCRAKALDQNERAVQICTDPTHYWQLQSSEARRRAKAMKAEGAIRLESMLKLIDQHEGEECVRVDRRLLMVVLSRAFVATDDGLISDAWKRCCLSDVLEDRSKGRPVGWIFRSADTEEGLQALDKAGDQACVMIKATAEAVIRYEIKNRYELLSSFSAATDWLEQCLTGAVRASSLGITPEMACALGMLPSQKDAEDDAPASAVSTYDPDAPDGDERPMCSACGCVPVQPGGDLYCEYCAPEETSRADEVLEAMSRRQAGVVEEIREEMKAEVAHA